MSACISSRGEYSSHELDDLHTCTWCGVLDEDTLRSELAEARAYREATEPALWAEIEDARNARASAHAEGVRAGWEQAAEAMRDGERYYRWLYASGGAPDNVRERYAAFLASLTPTTEENRT